jgi:sterol desaturase/sphingolipid hydroxylase (fatty acid hydroxylase superfamily)
MLLILSLAIALCYGLEFVQPVARRMPVATWAWRVWTSNAMQGLAALAAMALWFAMAGVHVSLLHLSVDLPAFAAGAIAYMAYTFTFYWWHRARHAYDGLWRVLHQIHHSPRRLETVTAFYKHPLETLANSVIAGVLMFWILGLDLHAAAVCTLMAALADLFYHANVRTPSWLECIIQRPEMHRLHHEADRHEGNYGDLPLWDWMFGTLRRARSEAVVCGFTAEREERFADMLRGIDVHTTERS